jgi:hydrogenase expression/formation protein HypC
MCLALPGKVLTLLSEDPVLPMALVDFAGVHKKICIAYTPEVTVGEYVIVHVGFAIQILSTERAAATLNFLKESLS